MESRKQTAPRAPFLTNRIDRVQIVCPLPEDGALPRISGFEAQRDHFAHCQTDIQTYRRVRQYFNSTSGTKIFLQYDPAPPWLSPVKITICPVDETGLRWHEINYFMSHFPSYRLLMVELSYDFGPDAGVDASFVRRHAILGKSRPRDGNEVSDELWYGTRKSAKFVRCYPKPELGVFRVELQLNSGWLRYRKIRTLSDLVRLPDLIFPKHFRFVQFRWRSVAKCLRDRGDEDGRLLDETYRRAGEVHEAVSFLGRKAGVANPHRFLMTMELTGWVSQQFRRWIIAWGSESI